MTNKEWKELCEWVSSLQNNEIYWESGNKGPHIVIETDCESCLEVYKNGNLIFTKYNFGKDDNYEEQSFVLKKNCNLSMINQIITIFGKQGR